MIGKKKYLVTYVIIFFISLFIKASAQELTSTQYQKIFREAQAHLNDQDLNQYYQLKAKLKNYALYPYLRYLEITTHFDKLSDETVENYLKEQKGTFWAMILKPQWLNYLGSNHQWVLYAKYGEDSGNIINRCWYAHALYVNQQQQQALKNFSSIWLYGHSLPEACDFLLTKWQGSKYDTKELRIKRVQLAMKQGEYDLAQYLSYWLIKSDQLFIQNWIKAEMSPETALVPFMENDQNHRLYDEAIVEAWDDFSEEAPVAASKLFTKYKNKLPKKLYGKVIANIAIELARDHDADALTWLNQVPNDDANSLLWQWRLRSAILWQKWSQLVKWINQMPEALRNQLQWQYWLAYGLNQTGDKKKATIIWSKLAKERDYYGFLAADQIGVPYNLQTKNYSVPNQALKEISNDPKMEEVYQLYQLKQYRVADSYWRWLLNRLDQEQILAAAQVANQWKIYSMSIYAYGRSGYYDDLVNRFPLAYKHDVLKYAKIYNLNPGWIWALTRQESYFHPEAMSGAGARGLMQLIPSTASFIASRFKIPYRGASSLFKPRVNIQLGTANLSYVYGQFGQNMVVATAAYNAGYGNAKSWLPNKGLDASCWIEIVPFLETRNYLRNVLTYTVIYENLWLHKNTRLKDLMDKTIQR